MIILVILEAKLLMEWRSKAGMGAQMYMEITVFTIARLKYTRREMEIIINKERGKDLTSIVRVKMDLKIIIFDIIICNFKVFT